ncbi:MAG: DUF3520 domain-containing protein [bacterium]|nr:DUF3520 domain-containing protein [bacterium]
MKRYLKNNHFQMSDHEKENLWLGIKDGGNASGKPRSRESNFAPVLGLTTVMVAVVILVVVLGEDKPPVRDIIVAQHEAQEMEITKTESGKSGPGKSGPAKPDAAQPKPTLPKPAKTTTLKGQVFEKDTGNPLAYANVIVEGTTQGVSTDDRGNFELQRMTPGQEVKLKLKYLGYEDEVASATPENEENEPLSIGMEPMVVATLDAFEVEGAEYMVEVKSALSEQTVSSETFEKFAIESVKSAISKNAGVVSRAGEIKGRRSQPDPGSVTGGTTAPNGESHELMYFDHTGVNPFVTTEEDALSTFAVDVDNASYTIARKYINGGSLPPKEAIRVEEFLNFFEAGYKQQSTETFAINLDGSPSRFGEGYHLVRVGLQGKTIASENRKSASLVFLIDISGSMNQGNRLGLVKHSLRVMVDELVEGDQVGIVVYGSQAEIVLPSTDVSQKNVILQAIDGLQTNGSTNAYEGLKQAYKMARENYQSHKLNRIVLCSDGVANMGGSTKAEEMLAQIRKASDKGITISTIGFGMGNYNDVLMEKLANQGDGNYYYVDQPDESERVFRENLTGMLQTIARQVKVQVEFDETQVKRWRLLGYENRDVADRDFRNDKIDAGEVGVGHQVTALYEVKLVEDAKGLLGTAYLRYEMPVHDSWQSGQVKEISQELNVEQLTTDFSQASARYRLQVVVCEFAEILRGSFWAKESQLDDLIPMAEALAEELSDDERVAELAGLIRKAADLQGE